MKKIILALATAALACTFCGCGSSESAPNSSEQQSSISIGEKTQNLLNEVEFPSMVEVEADRLDIYYGIAEDMITEFSAFICGSGAMPDEFGIFVAKDADTAAEIKSLVEDRISSQKDLYADYTPKELYKFDDSFVNINGNAVYYAICADNSKANEILK